MLRGSGAVVIIDAGSSGASGDKFLGALIDLGGKPESLEKIARAVEKNLADVKKVEVTTSRVERGEIGASLVSVTSQETVSKRKAVDLRASATKCAKTLNLSTWATGVVTRSLDAISSAESRVHGYPGKEVELQELGSADTLVDVLGVALLADELDLAEANWACGPIGVGKGTTEFSGRKYPNPAPAVAEILRSSHFPVKMNDIEFELTTPTGAALAVSLASKRLEGDSVIVPHKIGYGAGSKNLKGTANVLRLTVGEVERLEHVHDRMVILETNLDDVSGEVIGRAVEKIMAAGARDVSITPVFMKKNRPGQLISIIADRARSESLAQLLMDETGTLGVRELEVSRHISNRAIGKTTINVQGRSFQVTVKKSLTMDGKEKGLKIEYEDLRRISDQTGSSIRELQKITRSVVEEKNKG